MNKSTLFTFVAAMAAASVLSGCAKQKIGKVQLWAGGPYWAEKNIGAKKPWDYGLYFWWGDTVGYRRVGDAWVASDGSSSNFSFSENNTPTYGKDTTTLRSEGWTITKNGMDILASAHDAAHVHWGENWRLPTSDEFSELEGKCDWIWTTMRGVKGYMVRGRGDYASAYIFLPAADCGRGTSFGDAFSKAYADSYYWSSVPRTSNNYSWDLFFCGGGIGFNTHHDSKRLNGQPVRPVQDFAE